MAQVFQECGGRRWDVDPSKSRCVRRIGEMSGGLVAQSFSMSANHGGCDGAGDVHRTPTQALPTCRQHGSDLSPVVCSAPLAIRAHLDFLGDGRVIYVDLSDVCKLKFKLFISE